jgi:endonuclease/exonuclease/phosphatase family metal-dependent hydrolase
MAFRVMTYNIRLNTPRDGPNQWQHRRHRVLALILKQMPHLLGVQEALPEQMSDLRTGLSAYASYGVGRDDGNDRGEYSAIFYLRERYELLDQGTFWLSDTADAVGSRGWDAALPRICTWVKLRDRCIDQQLCFMNTHLDHAGAVARRESARLLLARSQQIAGASMSVILTGDFNTGPTSDVYRTMVNNTHFQDTKLSSETGHHGPDGTWATFDVKRGIADRIDYIYCTSMHFRVLQHMHLTDNDNVSYPSDHLPVVAELAFIGQTL